MISAQGLKQFLEEKHLAEREIIVIQTKRNIRDQETLNKISENIFGMKGNVPDILDKNTNTYGTTIITRSLPRSLSSPLVLSLPLKDQKEALKSLKNQLLKFQFDLGKKKKKKNTFLTLFFIFFYFTLFFLNCFNKVILFYFTLFFKSDWC